MFNWHEINIELFGRWMYSPGAFKAYIQHLFDTYGPYGAARLFDVSESTIYSWKRDSLVSKTWLDFRAKEAVKVEEALRRQLFSISITQDSSSHLAVEEEKRTVSQDSINQPYLKNDILFFFRDGEKLNLPVQSIVEKLGHDEDFLNEAYAV